MNEPKEVVSIEEQQIETLEAALEMALDALRKLANEACVKGSCEWDAQNALSDVRAFLLSRA